MSKGKVVVLGVNGHIGRAVAEAFVAKGWDVTGMARTDKQHAPGVHYVQGDSDSIEDMKRAIGDSKLVVNALNMRYDQWFEGRLEAQMARVVAAMGSDGKTMLFPGNIYNFAASDRVIYPDTPQRAQTVRGELRVRVEQGLEAAAARGDIQVLIIRAGEFYGPGSAMDWFDQVMFRDIKGGVAHTMGHKSVPHAWAYLPDLARAFEAIAAVRTTLGSFDRFHFAGNYVTDDDMARAILKGAPTPVKVTPYPIILLRILGLFDPIIREIIKMRYSWQNPMELKDERLADILGDDFNTPFDTAVATTIQPFFARVGLEPQSSANSVGRLA